MRYIKTDAIPDQIKYFNADDFVKEEIAYQNAMRDNVAYKEPTGYSSYQTDIGLNGPNGPAEAPNHGMFISEADASGGIPASSALGARDFAVAAAGAPAVGVGLASAYSKVANFVDYEREMARWAEQYRIAHGMNPSFWKQAAIDATNAGKNFASNKLYGLYKNSGLMNIVDDIKGTWHAGQYGKGGYGTGRYAGDGNYRRFLSDNGKDIAKAAWTYGTSHLPRYVGEATAPYAPYAAMAALPMAAAYSGYDNYQDWNNGNRQAVVDRVMSRPED